MAADVPADPVAKFVIRVLAVRPDGWLNDPDAWASFEPDGTGWLYAGDRRLNDRIDPREDFSGPTDFGWIGEDERGIWCTRDPYFYMLEHPEMWEGLMDAQIDQAMLPGDRRKPAFQFMTKVIAVTAMVRSWNNSKR